MSKFKVGDKVRRVNHSNSCSGVGDEESWVLPVGHVDTVSDVEGGWIRLAGYSQKTAVHGLEYFELVEEPKLKAGDRVRVKPGDYNGYYFSGDVGTVVEHPYKNTHDNLVYVRFSGHHNAKVEGGGYWWAASCNLDKLPVHYSSKFTDPAKAEQTTGPAPDSGLQKHSLGELYPLAVVGYGDNPMIFVLENLETGQVAGDSGDYGVRQWRNADLVVKFAKKYCLTKKPTGKVDDWGDNIVWFTGRPVNVNGYLEMPKITRKVQF